MTTTGNRLFPAAQFNTIEGCKLANHQAGQFFFEPGALRFFASRISSNIYRTPDGGALFITSEQFRGSGGYRAARKYTIRRILRNGHVETVGDFQQYGSSSGAHKAAARLSETMDAGAVPVSCATCDREIDADDYRAVVNRTQFYCILCDPKYA